MKESTLDLTTKILLQKYSPQDPRLKASALDTPLTEVFATDTSVKSILQKSSLAARIDPRLSWLLDNHYPLDIALTLYDSLTWPQPAIN